MRTLIPSLLALGLAGAGALVATAPAGASSADAPARTVTARKLPARPQTLAGGSTVAASWVQNPRTFLGPRFGVALGSGPQAQYPVVTTDGGRTWHTDGPALHVNAADAPQVVTTVSAASRSLQYAWGGGGQVVDVTSDGGRVWRSATFQGAPLAVTPTLTGDPGLIASVEVETGKGTVATWLYVTHDGGRTWTHVKSAF